MRGCGADEGQKVRGMEGSEQGLLEKWGTLEVRTSGGGA